MFLYLHGFRSSPLSAKSQIMYGALQARGQAQRWHCPQLSTQPARAIEQCRQLINTHHQPGQPLTIMGSSLGGFYATYLAEQWPNAQCVVLNPVVHAARDLAHYVGPLTNFHTNEPFEFTEADVAALAALEISQVTHPERYFLIAATGDELLDWREMAAHYAGAKQEIISGSDHGLSDFENYLPQVFAFLDGTDAATRQSTRHDG
ncbi:MAG TPA: YqiA/YcfP family alpha/beta fold hydrolase [Paenalcaligenes sp.]|nr:YqiA/YcfP family alpha/beta fold hydrolase [Paenalcaligenes sp.]